MLPFTQTINRAIEITMRARALQADIKEFFDKNRKDLGAEAGGKIYSAWDLVDQCWSLGIRDEGLFSLDIDERLPPETIVRRFKQSLENNPLGTDDTRDWNSERVPISMGNIVDKCEAFLSEAEALFQDGIRVHLEPPPFWQEPTEPVSPQPGYIEVRSIMKDGSMGAVMEIPVLESLKLPWQLAAYRKLVLTTAEPAEMEPFDDIVCSEGKDNTICIRPKRWFGKSSGTVFIRFDDGTATALHITFSGNTVTINKL